jgi:hypothetical protein
MLYGADTARETVRISENQQQKKRQPGIKKGGG